MHGRLNGRIFAAELETTLYNHLSRARRLFRERRYMNTQNYIVAFHIGRGGRFHNQGHKSFMPHIKQLSDCFSENSIIFKEDEEGNPLPDEQWQLIDGGGNVILEGRDNIESTTGILDWDGEYDTDIVQYLSESDDNEIDIIYQAYLDDEYMDDELKDYVCTQKGLHRIHEVKFYKCNAEIQCQDCTISYSWDGEDDVTEEEAAEWMKAQDIDPFSIKEHADSFESHFYND